MRKKRSRILTVTLALALTLLLAGCGPSEKDAEKYVQEFMKMMTGQEIDMDTFADINSQEDIDKLFEEGIQESIEASSIELSADAKDKLIEIEKKALQNCKYTVGSAVKAEEGFEVPVTFEPVILPVERESDYGEIVADYLETHDIMNLDTEDLQKTILNRRFELLEQAIASPTYREGKEVIIHYKELSENTYGVPEEDGLVVGENMLYFEEAPALPEVTPESMKERSKKLQVSAYTGQLDPSLSIDDLLKAAASYAKKLETMEGIIAETSSELEGTVDEEILDRYNAYIRDTYDRIQYEIGEARETESGYEVDFQIIVPDVDSTSDRVLEEMTPEVEAMDVSGMTKEEFNRTVYSMWMDRLAAVVDDPIYLEPVGAELLYLKTDEGVYEVDADSLVYLVT